MGTRQSWPVSFFTLSETTVLLVLPKKAHLYAEARGVLIVRLTIFCARDDPVFRVFLRVKQIDSRLRSECFGLVTQNEKSVNKDAGAFFPSFPGKSGMFLQQVFLGELLKQVCSSRKAKVVCFCIRTHAAGTSPR